MFIRFFFVWAGSACLLSGNPKIRNRKPETTDQRKQALQIRENYFADLLPLNVRGRVKGPQINIPCLLKFVRAMIMRT